MNRRQLLKSLGLAGASAVLAACQPTPVPVERVITRVVRETVLVPQKEIVREIVEVEKEITRLVEVTTGPERAAQQPTEVVLMCEASEISDDMLSRFDAQHAPLEQVRIDPDIGRLFAMITAGEPVDVVRIPGTYIPAFVTKRICLDLTRFFEASELLRPDDLLPVNDLFVVRDRRYGMGVEWSPDYAVFINKSLWAEAGVPIPNPVEPLSLQTWRELSAQLSQKSGGEVIVQGTDWQPNEHILFWATTTFSPPEHLFSEDMTRVRLLDNSKTAQFCKFWVDWLAEKGLPSPINRPATGWAGSDWRARRAASVMYGYWFTAMAESDQVLGDDIMMLRAPTWGPTYSNPASTGAGAFVVAQTPHPEAAWQLYQWFVGDEPAEERAASGWGLPALRSLLPLLPTEPRWRRQCFDIASLDMQASAVSHITWNPYITPPQFIEAWNTHLPQALDGTLDTNDMLQLVENEVNEAIQSGIAQVTR